MNTHLTIFQARKKVAMGVCTRLAAKRAQDHDDDEGRAADQRAGAAALEDGAADDGDERENDADDSLKYPLRSFRRQPLR